MLHRNRSNRVAVRLLQTLPAPPSPRGDILPGAHPAPFGLGLRLILHIPLGVAPICERMALPDQPNENIPLALGDDE